MNTTPQPPDLADRSTLEAVAQADKPQNVEMNVDSAGTIVTYNPDIPSPDTWQKWGAQVSELLAELPDYIGKFFTDNKRPILSVGLIFAGFITLRLALSVLDAINSIPLLAPTCELVGIGYTVWFVYRYLLQASTRQELSEEIESFKGQILGKDSPRS